MNRLTKGMRMCLRKGWHCKLFICRLATQARKMGLRLNYKTEDLNACPAFTQMVREGIL